MPIDDEPFEYRIDKSGKVHIRYRGRPVVVLAGKKGDRFAKQIDTLDGEAAQLLMARVTGNFKRGNERLSEQKHDSERSAD